jgi:hypothetical protein
MTSTSHRGAKSLKLLGSAQGAGVLRAGARAIPVDYQLDTFEERQRRSFGGELEGDLAFAADGMAAELELATGERLAVLLIKPDDQGADFRQAG